MATVKLGDLSKKMARLDVCMMTTKASRGGLSSRPMSNNGDVEYDGNSYFFTYEDSKVASELKANKSVSLGFQGKDMLFITIAGKATLVKSKTRLQQHWLDELKMWFKEGIETTGIIMIHVKADSIKYWHKEEQGEIKVK